MGKTVGGAVLWNGEWWLCVVCFAKRSDLSYIAIEGGEQAASGDETNNQEMNQTIIFIFDACKRFSLRVTKKIDSALRHIKQTAARGRWRRRSARESLLLTHSYNKGKSSPYMLVQLLLN
jgi:hypothetical protein